jgi:transaldolase
VTGLTSNPTIFHQAIKASSAYDASIRSKLANVNRGGNRGGKSGESLFFDVAIEDLRQAADLFAPVHERTAGVDGWVSLEVSPLLAYDTKTTLAEARDLHARAARRQPVHQDSRHEGGRAGDRGGHLRRRSDQRHAALLAGAIPRLRRGVPARHRTAHRGRPESRCAIGRFGLREPLGRRGRRQVPAELTNRLGIAIGQQCYKAYCELLASPRQQRVMNAGARPQRLLLASTGTKDPKASDILYIKALAAPLTINTMPENTLKAFADHGELSAPMGADGGDSEAVLRDFAKAGIGERALAAKLQEEGAAAFVKSWNELMVMIESKSAALEPAR